jgi:hypothetical protein
MNTGDVETQSIGCFASPIEQLSAIEQNFPITVLSMKLFLPTYENSDRVELYILVNE